MAPLPAHRTLRRTQIPRFVRDDNLCCHRELAKNLFSAYAHQQAALIKIYIRLVICPIYSVVKHRPRQLALTVPPERVWVVANPMFGAKRLSCNRELIHGCR
jgi:hypothetical protein